MKEKPTLLYYLSFALTIFLSSFLLFQVQPIIGKYILPWFGGTSFVWITSLLFFQVLLLVGYFYSYALTKLRLKQQLFIHFGLVSIIGVLTMLLFSHWSSPITPSIAAVLPNNLSPVLQILVVLTLSVGLPYFLLSTTSTLLQKWYSLYQHNKSPYPLYALSNIGSLLAIISYPFLIEPFFSLQKQGWLWSFFFIALCFLIILCTILSLRVKEKHADSMKPLHANSNGITKKQFGLWFSLPAISSIMLLAGTHHLTQGIAPIPFLWLLPLGLYLLSFILCFSERPFYKKNLYAYIFLILLPFILAFLFQPLIGVAGELITYGLMLFCSFMLCHGELYHFKPKPEKLNEFYLIMAFGSVVGALIVAIIAPLIFVGLFWEFILGLFFTTLIATTVLGYYENSAIYRKMNLVFQNKKEKMLFLILVVLLFYPIIAVLSYAEQSFHAEGIWRNYYSTLRIITRHTTIGDMRCLINGKITHGCQPTAAKQQMQIATYYGENSINLAMQSLRDKHKEPLHIGVLGLGIGTLAAYGKKGDTVHFYELNPLDERLAKTKFTYLSGTQAKTDIVLGDGRLSMQKELSDGKKQNFNFLAIDAFNDDSIPVHLLTKEAFALYRSHMAKDGILAVHISNSYLDLAPVVEKAAQYYRMHVVFVDAAPTNPFQTRSKWAFLTDDNTAFTTGAFQKATKMHGPIKDIPIWTDDYSNLFQLLNY
jgi:spermidine synthase